VGVGVVKIFIFEKDWQVWEVGMKTLRKKVSFI
jgi:hypothetical protein